MPVSKYVAVLEMKELLVFSQWLGGGRVAADWLPCRRGHQLRGNAGRCHRGLVKGGSRLRHLVAGAVFDRARSHQSEEVIALVSGVVLPQVMIHRGTNQGVGKIVFITLQQ